MTAGAGASTEQIYISQRAAPALFAGPRPGWFQPSFVELVRRANAAAEQEIAGHWRVQNALGAGLRLNISTGAY